MIRDHETNSLQPFDFSGIENKVPEIKKFGYLIDSISLKPLIDSSNINISSWVKIANIIQENYNDYDGFVVLHGTDTMSYSASALSFMVENLEKPIIFTGSQLPIGTLRTDGKENLITAIEIAAAKLNGSAIVPEVCVYFENKLFRGNRTTKQLQQKHQIITEIRGRGLMLACGLNIEGSDIVNDCMKRGLLINCTGGKTLRFVPPLIITIQEVDQAIAILDAVMEGK